MLCVRQNAALSHLEERQLLRHFLRQEVRAGAEKLTQLDERRAEPEQVFAQPGGKRPAPCNLLFRCKSSRVAPLFVEEPQPRLERQGERPA